MTEVSGVELVVATETVNDSKINNLALWYNKRPS